MGQNNTINRQLLLRSFGLLLWSLTTLACSKGAPPVQQIRAHTRIIQGVAHAEPAAKAERYCGSCHGKDLSGGTAAEPACYNCHGKNWLDDRGAASAALADHTAIYKGFHHRPGLFAPAAGCVGCHGQGLAGNTVNGATYPGCELCHARVWETATPPVSSLLGAQ